MAVADGNIIEVGNTDSYGNYIKYKIDDAYTIMYAHCNQIFAKKGDVVKQGQILASAGSTGISTGSHVHYSIWYNDNLIDPEPFLKSAVSKNIN